MSTRPRPSRPRAGRSASASGPWPTTRPRSPRRSASCCCASRTPRTPTRPTAPSDADNPVVKVVGFDPESYQPHQRVPHWETGAALGILDNERAVKISGSMFTMLRKQGATLSPRPLPAGARQQRRRLRGDPAAEPRQHAPRSPPRASSPSSPTTPTPSSATTCGASPPPRCRSRPSPRASCSTKPTCPSASWPTRRATAARPARRAATPGACCARTSSTRSRSSPTPPPTRPRPCSRSWSPAPRRPSPRWACAYRVIEICTGDLGQSHHRSFDIEVYAPGCDQWLEVSSISWFSDYQARRADIRYRPTPGDDGARRANEFIHTLNGSALAVPRVWAAIVETYRNPDGTVTVPEPLLPYLRGATVIS